MDNKFYQKNMQKNDTNLLNNHLRSLDDVKSISLHNPYSNNSVKNYLDVSRHQHENQT